MLMAASMDDGEGIACYQHRVVGMSTMNGKVLHGITKYFVNVGGGERGEVNGLAT